MRFLCVCFLLCSTGAYAQNGTLKGTLKAKSDGGPLATAAIMVQGQGGTRSDFDGNYEKSLPPGKYKVQIRLIGYHDKDTAINITANQTTTANFLLTTDSDLEEVVVAAGRFEQKIEEVSVSINIVKPDLIENKATIDCEHIMEQVPGLTVQDGQVSIRGGSGYAYGAGSRVLLLVDELPYLSADAGDAKWNALPVENIQQIEVLKGASSVLYGSSALNGVINIRTKYPTSKPETRINLHHGYYSDPKRKELIWWDENPYYYGGNFYHSRIVKKNFDLVFGGNFLSSIGFREGEDEDRVRLNMNTRYRSKKVDGLSYGVNMNHQFARTGAFVLWDSASAGYQPAGGADPSDPASTLTFQDGWRFNVDPFVTYFDKKGHRHSLRTRWFRTDNQNFQGRASKADLFYGEYQFQKYYDSLDMNLTAGVSTYANRIRADFYGNHDGTNAAIFAQVDKKWNKFNFNGGLRLEYFTLDDERTSYTLGNTELPFQPVLRTGMTYKLFEHTVLRASWGQGYRFPSVAEKFASTNLNIVTVFPNPTLQPERGWSGEIGAKQVLKLGDWVGYIDVAGFWTEYQNMIEFAFVNFLEPNVVFQTTDPNAPNYFYDFIGFQAQNAEDARITGLDISLAGTGKIKDFRVSVLAGYTFMNPITLNSDSSYLATFSDSGSVTLKYRYSHLIKGDVQVDYKKWSFGISSRYNSFMSNIDKTFIDLDVQIPNSITLELQDIVLPGIADYRQQNNRGDLVFDARLSYQLNEHSKMAFLINNLMNREYMGRPGDLQAPRTFIGQITVMF